MIRGIGTAVVFIAFIGVGVLMLVVGYFAPLPPKRSEPEIQTQGASS